MQILGDAEIAYQDALFVPGQRQRVRRIGGRSVSAFGGAAARALEQDVRRLDVSMYHAGFVNRGDAVGNGIDEQSNTAGVGCGGAVALEPACERAAVGEFHDEVRSAIVEPPDIVDRDHVGAADAPEQARFLEKLALDLAVVHQLRAQDLDGDERFQLLVPRLHDDRKAAGRYLTANLIATDVSGQRHPLGSRACRRPSHNA